MPQSPILVCYGLLELFSERCTVVKNSVYLQIRDEVHSKSLGSIREGAMKENVFSTRLQLKKVVGVLLIFLFTLLEHMQVERVRFSQSAPAPLNCSFFRSFLTESISNDQQTSTRSFANTRRKLSQLGHRSTARHIASKHQGRLPVQPFQTHRTTNSMASRPAVQVVN